MDQANLEFMMGLDVTNEFINCLVNICLNTQDIDEIQQRCEHMSGTNTDRYGFMMLLYNDIDYNVSELYHAWRARPFVDEPLNYETCIKYARKKILHGSFTRVVNRMKETLGQLNIICVHYNFCRENVYINFASNISTV